MFTSRELNEKKLFTLASKIIFECAWSHYQSRCRVHRPYLLYGGGKFDLLTSIQFGQGLDLLRGWGGC